jgi:hypothetical protein
MKQTYVKFCWKFDAPNSKVPPTHGKRGGGTISTTKTRVALVWNNTTKVKQQ